MPSVITQEDLTLVLQQSAAPQTPKLRIEVLDSKQRIVGTIYGIASGNLSISGESDVRRTASLTLHPTLTEKIRLAEDSLLWLNKDIRIFVSLYNPKTRQYREYPLGTYVYTDTSVTYDASSNSLTINCADFMKKLDGTKNGQLGTLTIGYPAYKEDADTGEVLSRYIISKAIVETLEKLANITDHRIDDIGEHNAMPEYNEDWETYRAENQTWNTIPYDLEFSAGCSVLSILTTLRDLYPNYEMFFDMESNAFICQQKPLCYEDDLFLDNSFLQRVLISENTAVDMTAVRNICEVWGQVTDPDFFAVECAFDSDSNTYNATLPVYRDKYCNGDVIAVKIPSVNQEAPLLNLNSLGDVPVCSDSREEALPAGTLKTGNVYAFKIRRRYVDGEYAVKACLLGQWQVHALNVLTNGRKSGQSITTSDGQTCELYSREYFQHFYNCDRVDMTIIANSPFTVEKIGETPEVKTGNEYETIYSDDLAADRAKWENWKNCRLTDNITITTILLPFLDVNKKVSYIKSGSDTEHQYIISAVSHNFSDFTSTITMYRFYPSYEMLLKEAGTHKALSEYTHGTLGKFTHDELITVISGQEL